MISTFSSNPSAPTAMPPDELIDHPLTDTPSAAALFDGHGGKARLALAVGIPTADHEKSLIDQRP